MPSRFRAREKRSASGRGDSAALLLFTPDRVERAPSLALAVGGSDNVPDLDQLWEDFVREAPRREAERHDARQHRTPPVTLISPDPRLG